MLFSGSGLAAGSDCLPLTRDRDLPVFGGSLANKSSTDGVWALGPADLLRPLLGLGFAVEGFGLALIISSDGVVSSTCGFFEGLPTDSDAALFDACDGFGVGVLGADFALGAMGGGAGTILVGSDALSIFEPTDFARRRTCLTTIFFALSFFTPFAAVGAFIPAGGGGGCGGGAPGSIAISSRAFGDLPRRGFGATLLSFDAMTPVFFTALPPLIVIGTAPGGGPGGGWSLFETSIGCPLLLVRSRGFRPARPKSAKRDTYDWSAVEECGPRRFAICSAIAIFFSNLACACSAKTFDVPSNASCMSSPTDMSNCSGLCVCVAAEAAMILAPLLGGGGGAPLDDDTDNAGLFGGMRPRPPLLLCLNRGMAPEGGSSGGGLEKLCASWLSGLNAVASATLPTGSAATAALISICCACSFVMFSCSFSKSKNSLSSYFVNCCVLRNIEACLSGNAILSFGSKIVSLTSFSYVGR